MKKKQLIEICFWRMCESWGILQGEPVIFEQVLKIIANFLSVQFSITNSNQKSYLRQNDIISS